MSFLQDISKHFNLEIKHHIFIHDYNLKHSAAPKSFTTSTNENMEMSGSLQLVCRILPSGSGGGRG